LGHRLLSGDGYVVGDTFAYWPPGYPLFLVPWLALLPDRAAIVLSQVSLFVIMTLGSYRLTTMFAGPSAGRVTALLLALWPNLVAHAGTPEKEMLVAALLPWVVRGALRLTLWGRAAAGLGLGFVVLSQPSMQLLLPAAIVVIFWTSTGWARLLHVVVFLLSATLVIAPWTVRNHAALGKFVLVSTNSGDVLYRANNPRADGGYQPRGEIDLTNLTELDKDRRGRELALEWIQSDPRGFVALIPRKQILLMGDDATGVYRSLQYPAPQRLAGELRAICRVEGRRKPVVAGCLARTLGDKRHAPQPD
jgi:hypothetical protein